MILSPFQSFEVPMQDAAAAGQGLKLPFSTQQHFIAQNPSPLNVPLPSLLLPFLLSQGGPEELEEISGSLCLSPLSPNAGGGCHRWRRSSSVLYVSQAWSMSAPRWQGAQPSSPESLLGACPPCGSWTVIGFGLGGLGNGAPFRFFFLTLRPLPCVASLSQDPPPCA